MLKKIIRLALRRPPALGSLSYLDRMAGSDQFFVTDDYQWYWRRDAWTRGEHRTVITRPSK